MTPDRSLNGTIDRGFRLQPPPPASSVRAMNLSVNIQVPPNNPMQKDTCHSSRFAVANRAKPQAPLIS